MLPLYPFTNCLQTRFQGLFNLSLRLALHIQRLSAPRQELTCVDLKDRLEFELRAEEPHLNAVSLSLFHKQRVALVQVGLNAQSSDQIKVFTLSHQSFCHFLRVSLIQGLNISDHSEQVCSVL
jgi:hypothetical protein